MDNDAHSIEKISAEKSLLQGQIGELQARIRTLELHFMFQIAALKCQMDNDAHSIEKISAEKSLLQGQIGELQARIRTLEGQVIYPYSPKFLDIL